MHLRTCTLVSLRICTLAQILTQSLGKDLRTCASRLLGHLSTCALVYLHTCANTCSSTCTSSLLAYLHTHANTCTPLYLRCCTCTCALVQVLAHLSICTNIYALTLAHWALHFWIDIIFVCQIQTHSVCPGNTLNWFFVGFKWKWNESGFRPLLRTYRLNWARRTYWGWWDEWDGTALQTQDLKFKPWKSKARHATSRSRRLPKISFTSGWGRNIFGSFKPPGPGNGP